MPFKQYDHDFIDKNKKASYSIRLALLSSALIVIFNVLFLEHRDFQEQLHNNPGSYTDAIALVFLFFILSCTSKISLNHTSALSIRLGLHIWICSATFDFMDEFVYQTKFIGYYVEDLLRIFGMFGVGFGVYNLIYKINDKYIEAKIQSFSDELTQLPNRRFFINELKKLEAKSPYLFIIDIDNFKVINDKYGHIKGDEVLSKFGHILSRFDNSEVVATRIGGEEFAIILYAGTQDRAEALAREVLKNASKIIIKNRHHLSVSIGAGQKQPQEPTEHFMKRVDVALYQAKSTGKGKVEWALEPTEKTL
ncbi:GGDEF domain-containing protein [Pectobacterium parvum]|uniref:GGDEF domain-containing protein n=1 Tax=Pectobacterium parvum TaxID=2778550 RepID=UPI000508819F|nr:GGDEF domain-containing protein [Pectobacterium parvum]KFX12093.1 membrane protein [Pectobacterium parvum]MCU1802795.1 GGDEF domain-containing protein [Pectobacterium parvum]UFK38233.1 GGDEF domain-containing protein [Pectobacterium parvum]